MTSQPDSVDICIATWNFEDFGYDRSSRTYPGLPMLAELVTEACPDVDVLFLQEVRDGARNGSELVFQAERSLRELTNGRGFLRTHHSPPKSGESRFGQLIVVRDPLFIPQCHYVHGAHDVFHDQAGFAYFYLAGTGTVVGLQSLHWAYHSGDQRMDSALKLTGHAAPGLLRIIAGDCNSIWPDCGGNVEFEPGWLKRPPHKRSHKTMPPGIRPPGVHWVSDRRALTVLDEAGFVSLGGLGHDMTATVNDDIDNGQGARIDHLIASPEAAAGYVDGSYRVHVSDLGDRASDHRLVSARIRLRLQGIAGRAAG